MLNKIRQAFTLLLLLALIAMTIVLTRLIVLSSFEYEQQLGINYLEHMERRINLIVLLQESYAVLMMLIKPLFVLIVMCYFSPTVAGKFCNFLHETEFPSTHKVIYL